MANGLISKIPGVSKYTKAVSKFKGDSSKEAAPTPTPDTGGRPGQIGWASPVGVNGTTNPRGIGKWGVGV